MAARHLQPMITSPGEPGMVARDVLDSLLEGCQVIGFDWTYLYVNDAVARQAGRTQEQLLGRTMMECFPGIDQSPMFVELRKCMSQRTHHRMENEFTFPDGTTGWFELQFVPVPRGTCVLSIDLTQRKRAEAALSRAEEQLRQAQKMEAIGRLAGGVAHDFNNMLSVILSYAALSLETLSPGDPVREDIAEIERAGERARDLTSQLLAISRQQVFQPKLIDLNQSLATVDKMLRRVLGADVELRTVAAPTLGYIKADAGHIEQAVLNLAINARDAMPLGGKVTIETAGVELDDQYAREHLGTKPGPHVMLAVSDTGHGMDKATQARIFEPFFTTKPVGKGTGLGLSTVFGIVQQSGGSIWVYSEPGKGTTFKLYFPLADEAALEDAVVQSAPLAPRLGAETILVVDDDEQLRRLAAGILQRKGHEVLSSGSAAEAIATAEQHSGTIHVLLTDLVMPGVSGRQLAEHLRGTRPEMKVLYMSGYTGDVVMHHGDLDHAAAFVPKPITPNALSRALEAILDPPAT